MEKREINELEPYLEKRTGFTWLPQSNTDYYESEIAHANLKSSQNKRALMNIPDIYYGQVNFFF